MKKNNHLYMLFLLVCTQSCLSQSADFVYKKVKEPVSIFESSNIKFKKVEDYLPQNFVRDGTVDYTSFVQLAIDENNNISFPNFPILINDTGLKLRSNSNIFFTENASLLMKPSKKTKFSFLYLNGVDKVTIYNPTLKGERKQHLDTKGEWGMGISLYGASNIKIYNAQIQDTWGDGIYISNLKEAESKNVLIKNGQIDNARRNGISIISGKNIIVDNVLISNTNGKRPGAGIDIEPNHRTDILDNIQLTNIKTFNNQNEGILLVLTRIGNESLNKNVSIHIMNHIDDGSDYAMRFGSGFRKKDKPLSGKIMIQNSQWLNNRNKNVLKINGDLNNLPNVSFENVVIDHNKHSFNSLLNKLKKNNQKFNTN